MCTENCKCWQCQDAEGYDYAANRNLTERLAQAKRERNRYKAAADKIAVKWNRDGARIMAERDAALANAVALETELTDLRARIEALADKWLRDKWMPFPESAHALRALLQPPKAETALDVLSDLEKHLEAWPSPSFACVPTLAKLRKLLETQERDCLTKDNK